MKLQQKIRPANIKGFVSENKLIDFGVYPGLPSSTNTNVWDNKKAWFSTRRWQRKSWIFLGAYSADIFVGFAIVDAGYLAKAFCYVYFPKTGELLEDGIDRPLGFPSDFNAGFGDTWQLGNYKIYTQASGRMLLEYHGKKFSLTLACQNNDNGLSFVCPSEGKSRPFHFTYKNLLIPIDIQLTHKNKTQDFKNLYGGIDYSKGYPPKHTTWNWASFIGTAADGTPVGINLVNDFNQNMENIIWWGKEQILTGKVCFEYQVPLDKSKWRVTDLKDQLKINLTPNGLRKENINIKLLKSKFTQVFGKMSGAIKRDGQWIDILGYGVMEEHEAIW